MRKLATMLVIALATMATQQAEAVELLVRVGDTIDATRDASGSISTAAARISTVQVAPYQVPARNQVLGQLQLALGYETSAMSAAYACRGYAKIITNTDPRDPQHAEALDNFDAARTRVFHYARTARAIMETAASLARSIGLDGVLSPALVKSRQAEQEAEDLNRWIEGGRSDLGIVPLML